MWYGDKTVLMGLIMTGGEIIDNKMDRRDGIRSGLSKLDRTVVNHK